MRATCPCLDHPRSRGVYLSSVECGPRLTGSSPLARGLPDVNIVVTALSEVMDHPRSRGVYAMTDSWPEITVGSSPLARGLPADSTGMRGPPRIIPARAGFTSAHLQAPGLMGDHPRSRGVYRTRRSLGGRSGGSSPLARGLPDTALSWGPVRRIIPARAGFTPTTRTRLPAPTDHPRSRGVYYHALSIMVTAAGSSPLARGLPAGLVGNNPPRRIIPARAGFTPTTRTRLPAPTDHPRSRGVYYHALSIMVTAAGSSPLARGLPAGLVGNNPPRRIIPARAGFTAPVLPGGPRRRDHPRSRGVYPVRSSIVWNLNGSSPLARGLPALHRGCRWRRRIIPARAGFTISPGGEPSPVRDHPRSRGVYAHLRAPNLGIWGSSPLARGLPVDIDLLGRQAGIIPARAGFTQVAAVGADALEGSSPLARGLHDVEAGRRPGGGIIPARAGFTWWRPGRDRRAGDHPRSRGVYAASLNQPTMPPGSSPLARGLQAGGRTVHGRGGIIPARAGFTVCSKNSTR